MTGASKNSLHTQNVEAGMKLWTCRLWAEPFRIICGGLVETGARIGQDIICQAAILTSALKTPTQIIVV